MLKPCCRRCNGVLLEFDTEIDRKKKRARGKSPTEAMARDGVLPCAGKEARRASDMGKARATKRPPSYSSYKESKTQENDSFLVFWRCTILSVADNR